MENLKLDNGATFIEFYYTGLMIETSWELVEYIKLNSWYFDRMREDIKEQFRNKYKRLKAMEEKEQC
jgi:hypothetical protein